jgi:hypothetical protein
MVSSLRPLWNAAVGLAAAGAASQGSAGEIGLTSRETVAIRLSIAPRVEVRGLADLQTDSGKASTSPEGRAICVSANTPTRSYGVSLLAPPGARGPGPGRAATPPVFIEWVGDGRRSPGTEILPGSTVTGFIAPQSPCTPESAPNARLIIRPAAKDMPPQAAAATLLIVPE